MSGGRSKRKEIHPVPGRNDQEFHVLYVGQIELDNVGLDGTPANDRLYSDERCARASSPRATSHR